MLLDNDHHFIRITFFEALCLGQPFIKCISFFISFAHRVLIIIQILGLLIFDILQNNLVLPSHKIINRQQFVRLDKILITINQYIRITSARQVMENRVIIIYNKFCPYAQRALITSLQKNINATFQSVSLKEKSQYFTQTYFKAIGKNDKSNGQVPILIHNDKIITGSELVCWYLSQTFEAGSNLIPPSPLQKLKMRCWINIKNPKIISIFDRSKTKNIGDMETFKQEIRHFLDSVNTELDGPYLIGQNISLADILIYPWFQRWIIIQHFFQIKIDSKYPKLHKWFQLMQKRQSVSQTKKMTTNEFYLDRVNKMMAKL